MSGLESGNCAHQFGVILCIQPSKPCADLGALLKEEWSTVRRRDGKEEKRTSSLAVQIFNLGDGLDRQVKNIQLDMPESQVGS
jgi:hypothetical protein